MLVYLSVDVYWLAGFSTVAIEKQMPGQCIDQDQQTTIHQPAMACLNGIGKGVAPFLYRDYICQNNCAAN
jgi:hypothetical protein